MDSGIRDDDPFDYIFGNYYDSEKKLPFVSNDKLLLELNIRHDHQHPLEFKPGLEQTLLPATRSLDHDSTFMSSDNFHSVIKMISKSTTLKAGGSVKSFVDAFIYRAIAMIKPPEYVTVDAEYGLVGIGAVPSITYTPACIVDYRIVASNTTAAQANLQPLICNLEFLKSSHPLTANKLLEKGIGNLSLQGRSTMPLSVLEPEPKGTNLEDCIPHLAWKMYATAKTLKKPVIRGVLTDGFEWVFLILNVDHNGGGASYSCSSAFPVLGPQHMCESGSYEDNNDILTGVLASWIRRNSEPLSEMDWLNVN